MSTKKTAVAKRTVDSKESKSRGEVKPMVKGKIAVATSLKSKPASALVKSTTVAKSAAPIKTLEQKISVVKEDAYKSGDKVVYPAHGVGAIDSVQSKTVGGIECKFFMITILETGMKVMVPVAQAQTVGLRKIVDEKTVEKVYDILRDKDVIVQQQTWNRRYREYTQKLKTGSVFEIAKVIRDLSVLKGDKELSFGERKMLDMAQGLLVKEISIAKASPEDHIRAELQKICDA